MWSSTAKKVGRTISTLQGGQMGVFKWKSYRGWWTRRLHAFIDFLVTKMPHLRFLAISQTSYRKKVILDPCTTTNPRYCHFTVIVKNHLHRELHVVAISISDDDCDFMTIYIYSSHISDNLIYSFHISHINSWLFHF
jgi:hypothetical protein